MNDNEPSLFGRFKEAAQAVGSFMVGVVSFLGEVSMHFSVAVHAADGIARRYRWCISTSWPLNLIISLGEMADRNAPYYEFEAAMLGFYSAGEWREVEALVKGTCAYESVSPLRRTILRDTVLLIRAGERDGFNAAAFAVTTLFAQLEGLLRDFARKDLALVEGQTKKTITVRDIVPTLRGAAEPVERPSLDVIVNLLYKSYRSKNPPQGRRFSRHLFNHGRALEPGRISYVIRLLLMIDQVAYLIDKVRGVESDAVQTRRNWSELLSASSEQGPRSKAILDSQESLRSNTLLSLPKLDLNDPR